jgi:sensor c-di-GMP phosphodiesterase-like protein
MARPLLPIACFAAGAASALFFDYILPKHRFQHMARELARGLRRSEFELHYQPIVSLRQQRWAGFEALLRWRRHNGGFVSPDIFLPIAGEANLLEPLSERVIELVARDMTDMLQRHPDLYVGINVPPQLLGRGRLEVIARRCGLLTLAPQVVIEVTETGIVDDRSRAGLQEARALGVRVAIDDFGTGLNGLAQLQDMEIDFIKIDKSFVRKIGSASPGAKLVDAVVTIARDLGAKTIAEGVETPSQAEYLQALGVDYGQGYLFSKALPLRDIRAHLAPARLSPPYAAPRRLA